MTESIKLATAPAVIYQCHKANNTTLIMGCIKRVRNLLIMVFLDYVQDCWVG